MLHHDLHCIHHGCVHLNPIVQCDVSPDGLVRGVVDVVRDHLAQTLDFLLVPYRPQPGRRQPFQNGESFLRDGVECLFASTELSLFSLCSELAFPPSFLELSTPSLHEILQYKHRQVTINSLNRVVKHLALPELNFCKPFHNRLPVSSGSRRGRHPRQRPLLQIDNDGSQKSISLVPQKTIPFSLQLTSPIPEDNPPARPSFCLPKPTWRGLYDS
mmetsp:Transcript_43663/g.170864  ORF Transcript_43663/g.170864 Transcript_43663/m.170864 type:complete len:215 (-) Transcript_43663:189-833(-)